MAHAICYGLVRQLSGFITVSVSEYGTCRILDSTGFKGGEQPRPKTSETAALWRGIHKDDVSVDPLYDLLQSAIGVCDSVV